MIEDVGNGGKLIGSDVVQVSTMSWDMVSTISWNRTPQRPLTRTECELRRPGGGPRLTGTRRIGWTASRLSTRISWISL
jgi:hypothetical protein